MTTGATLFLVSACGSAEEFVAAFRRYADRTGLFVPSAAPLPAGRRGRLALTLKDGGVMIEGEAEILQSSSKPTVLHGRPGMTLKFVEPDDLSKTVIAELEKARLAMKPAPPSVPPRPSDVPAEPRPVVPALGGRIDAANALAECVVIGDPASLVDTAKADNKKFVVPSIPAVGAPRPNTPSSPPPMRPHSPSNPPPVGGVPSVIGQPGSGSTPRPKTPSVPPDPASRPLPAPVLGKPGHKPTSIGFPVVGKAPAFPPKTQVPGAPPVENPLLSTKLGMDAPPNRTTAMEAQEPPAENPLLETKLGTPGSARAVNNATTLGMPSLDKAPAASGRAISVHDEATTIGEMPPTAPAAAVAPPPEPVVEETTAVGMEPPTPPKKKTDPMPAAAPATPTASANKSGSVPAVANTSDSVPAVTNKSGSVPAVTNKSGSMPAQPPTPGSVVVATPGKPQHRATSIGFPAMGRTPFETQPVGIVRSPVVPDGADGAAKSGSAPTPRGKNPTRPPLTPRHPTPVAPVPIVRGPAKAAPLVEDAIVENAIEEEEKTDLSEVPVPPSKSTSMATAEIDPLATTQISPQRSGGMRASEIMAAIPSGDWTMSPDASGPTVVPGGALPPKPDPTPAGIESKIPPKGPPTGNWSIALDPETGWSEPVKLKSEPPPEPAPAPAPAPGKKRKGTGVAGNPDRHVADEKGFMAVEWEEKPTGIGEAKIEIDSTLMEPLKPMPALDDDDEEPEASGSSSRSAEGARSNPAAIKYVTPPAGMPAVTSDSPFAAPTGASPFAAQPVPNAFAPDPLMTARVAPRPFTPPAGLPAVQQPRPLTPPAGLPAVPPGASYSNPGMPVPQSQLFARSASQPVADPNQQAFNMMGYAQPGFSAPATPAANKRKKQTIIIAIGAIAALAAGFVLVLVLAGGKDKKSTAQTKGTGSGSARVIDQGSNTKRTGSGSAEQVGSGSAEAAVGSNDGSAADGSAGSGSAVAAVETPADAAVPDVPTPAGGPCKVSVASTPNGADVLLDNKKVGTTPFDLELPCGVEAKLTLRKAKFINTAKSFTPVDGKGNKVLVKLAKTTYAVKVTSTPAGATITVGGRSMGVTPASIRLPAFEAAAIMVSKPGFKTDSKTVTPKNNNTSHHVVLKKGR